MKITIVTVVYNNLEGLKETVNSVLGQNNVELEYIIVDGASTDGTVEYLKELSNNIPDNIVFKYISEKDTGIYNAMNKGAKLATGDYIQYLNAEDRLYDENAIKEVYDLIDDEFDVYYGTTIIDAKEFKYIPQEHGINEMPNRIMVNKHPSSFTRKKIMCDIGFDESYKSKADYNLFLYLYLHDYKFKRIDVIVSMFKAGGFSSNNYALNYIESERIRKKQLNMQCNKLKYTIILFKMKIVDAIRKIIPKNIIEKMRIKKIKKRIKKDNLIVIE